MPHCVPLFNEDEAVTPLGSGYLLRIKNFINELTMDGETDNVNFRELQVLLMSKADINFSRAILLRRRKEALK